MWRNLHTHASEFVWLRDVCSFRRPKYHISNSDWLTWSTRFRHVRPSVFQVQIEYTHQLAYQCRDYCCPRQRGHAANSNMLRKRSILMTQSSIKTESITHSRTHTHTFSTLLIWSVVVDVVVVVSDVVVVHTRAGIRHLNSINSKALSKRFLSRYERYEQWEHWEQQHHRLADRDYSLIASTETHARIACGQLYATSIDYRVQTRRSCADEDF